MLPEGKFKGDGPRGREGRRIEGRKPDLRDLDLKIWWDLGNIPADWPGAVPADTQEGLEAWYFSIDHIGCRAHRVNLRSREE